METLSNVANAASKAIFGESTANSTQSVNETGGQEPLSGELSDTSKGKPYDAGNADSKDTDLAKPQTTKTTGLSTKENPDAKALDLPIKEKKDASTFDLPIRGKQDTTTSDLPSREKLDTSTNTTASDEAPGNTTCTAPTQTSGLIGDQPSSGPSLDKPSSSYEPVSKGAEPSVSADPSSGAHLKQKQQGADRPQHEPGSDEHEAIKDAKKESEEGQSIDVSGPGPAPLGQRGNASGGDDDDDGPQKISHGDGTGEKYVRSTDIPANGGDFDAANPGAGKESPYVSSGSKMTEPDAACTPCEDTQIVTPDLLQEIYSIIGLQPIRTVASDGCSAAIVVQRDDTKMILKVTSFGDVDLEVNVMRLVGDTVPVPTVYKCGTHLEVNCILMSYIADSVSMLEFEGEISEDVYSSLRKYINDIRSLQCPSNYASTHDYNLGICKSSRIKYRNSQEFIERVLSCMNISDVSVPLLDRSKLVLSHCDLWPRNVMISADGVKVTAIVDWQTAGYYPDFYEYLSYRFRCNVDGLEYTPELSDWINMFETDCCGALEGVESAIYDSVMERWAAAKKLQYQPYD